MDIEEMAVPDAYRLLPRLIRDERGCFYESYKYTELADATGHVFCPLQVNYSVSARDTLRGLHGVRHPPAQAKLVTCVRGVLWDVVVDVRPGSPAFGTYDVTRLDAREGTAVYVAEGLAHGFLALTDDASICYLCSTEFVPGTQFGIDPFDPGLGVPWASVLSGPPLLSRKDAEAPSVREAADRGLLADYQECRALYARLRSQAGRQDDTRSAAGFLPRRA
ncbi:dTDP-4-dehydrorhamnose 3,5-epimerase family protein [Streptomyces tremellae]